MAIRAGLLIRFGFCKQAIHLQTRQLFFTDQLMLSRPVRLSIFFASFSSAREILKTKTVIAMPGLKGFFSGCLLMIAFAFQAFGQDTHYWTNQYGTRSTLLGGAVRWQCPRS